MRMADTLFYCTCLLTATIIGMEVSLSITELCVRKSARTPYLDMRLQDGRGACAHDSMLQLLHPRCAFVLVVFVSVRYVCAAPRYGRSCSCARIARHDQHVRGQVECRRAIAETAWGAHPRARRRMRVLRAGDSRGRYVGCTAIALAMTPHREHSRHLAASLIHRIPLGILARTTQESLPIRIPSAFWIGMPRLFEGRERRAAMYGA